MSRQPNLLANTVDAETVDAEPAGHRGLDTDPDRIVERILLLLNQERFSTAKELIRVAAERFPEHPRIRAARRGFLDPPKARGLPATEVDRSEEYAWLRDPPREYRGKWVALIRREVVAAADDLLDLIGSLEGKTFSRPTLIHQVV